MPEDGIVLVIVITLFFFGVFGNWWISDGNHKQVMAELRKMRDFIHEHIIK